MKLASVLIVCLLSGCIPSQCVPDLYGPGFTVGVSGIYSPPLAQSIFVARFDQFKQAYSNRQVSSSDYQRGISMAGDFATEYTKANDMVEAFERGEVNQGEVMEQFGRMTESLNRVVEFVEKCLKS